MLYTLISSSKHKLSQINHKLSKIIAKYSPNIFSSESPSSRKGKILIKAASSGDCNLIKSLLKDPVPITNLDICGAFFSAAGSQHIKSMEILWDICKKSLSEPVEGQNVISDVFEISSLIGHAVVVDFLIEKCRSAISKRAKILALENALPHHFHIFDKILGAFRDDISLEELTHLLSTIIANGFLLYNRNYCNELRKCKHIRDSDIDQALSNSGSLPPMQAQALNILSQKNGIPSTNRLTLAQKFLIHPEVERPPKIENFPSGFANDDSSEKQKSNLRSKM